MFAISYQRSSGSLADSHGFQTTVLRQRRANTETFFPYGPVAKTVIERVKLKP